MYINTVHLNGNLGADSRLGEVGDSPVLNFRFANTSPFGKKVTTWFNASIYGKQATVLAPMLKKGAQVYVQGEISLREYEQNGEKRTSLDIRANSVQLFPRGSNGESVTFQGDPAPDEDDTDVPF